jgi:hypothetical protein
MNAPRAAIAAFLFCSTALAQESAPHLHGGGFAGVTFERSGFAFGELDLYATATLSDQWSVISEGFLSHAGRDEGGGSSPKHFESDLERLSISFSRSDRLRVEGGFTHTGIVRWNEREHRGRFLQTPIDVPAIAAREEQGGAWPLHFDGLWFSGRLGGPLGVEYGAGVGKARASVRDEVQPVFDSDSTPAQLFTLSVAPDALRGFQFGGAEYSGDIPAPEGSMREVDQTLFTAFTRGGAEIRAEWAQMHHTRFGDRRRFVTRGGYALLSWRPRGRWEVLRPYILLDRLDVARGEPYLADVHDQRAWAVGLRWDARPWLAVKTDLRGQLSPEGNSEHLLRLQIAVSF